MSFLNDDAEPFVPVDVDALSNLDDVAAALAKLTAMVAKFEEAIAPLQAQADDIDKDRKALKAEYDAKMGELNGKSLAIENLMFETKRDLRKIKQNAESVSRQYHELNRAEQLKSEYLTLEAKWDSLTIGAPWREWAKDHQIEAARKITWSQRMILGDTMGLGKTLSAIAALDIIQAATKDASEDNPFMAEAKEVYNYHTDSTELKWVGGVRKPCGIKVLYFCPDTMIYNVRQEIKRWAPHRNVIELGGQPKATRRFLLDMMKDYPDYVVILNYAAWRRDKSLIDDLIDIEFDTIIIDEAHNVKDMASVAYRGIKRIVDNSDVPFVVPMTGTPILNRPQELYSLLTFVAPEQFYSLNNFLRDYCTQDPDSKKWTFKYGGVESLSKKIGSRFLRRTKEQAGIILPPKTIMEHVIEIDAEAYPNQARVREEMRKWGSIMLDPDNGKSLTAAAMIAVYTRLRQIETWPAGIVVKDRFGDIALQVEVEESQKIDEIIRPNGEFHTYADAAGLLPEIVEDERVVIFSQFKPPLKELAKRCEAAGIRAVVMDGDTPDEVRREIQDDFDARTKRENPEYQHKWDVVLCNYRVGGVGVNFTDATQMIILDEEWNPGKRDQAYDRIHRMGQDKPVTIHVLRVNRTVDNWLESIISEKEAMIDGFHNVADNMAQQMFDALKSGLI
jgi:SNF2 family DNA or RNA helicase